MKNSIVSKIWKAVKDDLTDRKGIRHEWNSCDKEILKEIDDTNMENIKKILDKECSKINFSSFNDINFDGLEFEGKCVSCKKKYVISGQGLTPQSLNSKGHCCINFGCPHCEEPETLYLKLNFSIDIVK